VQAISLPYDVDDAGHEVIVALRRVQSAAVRSAYANAPGRNEEELRDLLKARFPGSAKDPGSADAWLIHCATREGLKLRGQRPDGKLVFGGRKNLERRRKGLISAGDWRSMRLLPLVSTGDKSRFGNRHFTLSADARTCTLRVYGHAVVLALPEMRGKQGRLLRAVAALAAAGEINVEFRLGHERLSVVFDPADLRLLPAGVTLQQDDDARLAAKGRKARGRPRGENWKPAPFRWEDVERPVHPEWGPAIAARSGRCLGIDLNPDWIGLTVVENLGDIRSLPSPSSMATSPMPCASHRRSARPATLASVSVTSSGEASRGRSSLTRRWSRTRVAGRLRRSPRFSTTVSPIQSGLRSMPRHRPGRAAMAGPIPGGRAVPRPPSGTAPASSSRRAAGRGPCGPWRRAGRRRPAAASRRRGAGAGRPGRTRPRASCARA